MAKRIQKFALLIILFFHVCLSFASERTERNTLKTFSKDYTLFWVENLTHDPNGLSIAEFEINNETGGVCSTGAGNYCSTEKLITLKNIPNGNYIFNLIRYTGLGDSNKEFNNIDSSCLNHIVEIQPHLTTISIEGYPSNILTPETRIICKYKDYGNQ